MSILGLTTMMAYAREKSDLSPALGRLLPHLVWSTFKLTAGAGSIGQIVYAAGSTVALAAFRSLTVPLRTNRMALRFCSVRPHEQ